MAFNLERQVSHKPKATKNIYGAPFFYGIKNFIYMIFFVTVRQMGVKDT